ncbi:hypothetical protein [Streptomyces sp. NPDC086010]|uniref:hypothetical protein n=1 Tax=Streptomyces sp. NPDC086010 TaxID=3365745 RepID=UPI0037D72199
MTRRLFRRCATGPGPLAPEDQAAVAAFRAMLAALRHPQPWTPGRTGDVAVRVGPFVERARPRPGDDRGPDTIAVALQHPDGPAAPYAARYRTRGWLRCETAAILGTWQSSYALLTHAAAGQDLPDDVGMPPAHYAVHIEASTPDTRHPTTVLRLGPYTQTGHTTWDADRINSALAGCGRPLTAQPAPFDIDDRERYADPYETDALALLAATAGVPT